MNNEIKINKKQLRLLAIEVLLKNVKSDYDRRNKFDDMIVREIAESVIDDGMTVILSPFKYISKVEKMLCELDTKEMNERNLKWLRIEGELGQSMNYGRSRKALGMPAIKVPTEEELMDSFTRSTAFKKHVAKAMKL